MPRIITPGIRPAGRSIELTFEGETIPAIEGETLAAALTAAGKLNLRDDPKGGVRGVFCGMGSCFECLVTVDGRASQRACMTKVRAGMRVTRQGYATRRVDRNGPALSPCAEGDTPIRECEVLVVGAGPAGLAAAGAAGRAGAHVVLIDERVAPGGQYFKQIAASHRVEDRNDLDRQFRKGLELIDEVRELGVEILDEATVWGAFAGDGLGIIQNGEAAVWRASQIVLAIGAYERPLPIPGATLPGFMTTGAVQTLLRSYRVAPGHRVLLAGNGPLNLQVAADVLRAGTEVVAVVEAAPFPGPSTVGASLRAFAAAPDLMLDGSRYLLTLAGRRVPLLYSRTLTRVEGDGRVERVHVARVDRQGRICADTEKAYDVDLVSAGYGFLSATELARQLGCRHEVDPAGLGNLVAVRDENGETTMPGVFVAGDAGAILGARVAHAQGALAGLQAARNIGKTIPPDLEAEATAAGRQLRRGVTFQKALWTLFRAPPFRVDTIADEAIICRCESVSAGRIRELIADGLNTIGEIKRVARVGMGRCQGRYCQHVVARMLSEATGKPLDSLDFFYPRPPAKPVPVSALARKQPDWRGFKESRRDGPDIRSSALQPEPWEKPVETDVLIIGAGILGVSVAYHLSRAGIDVVLVDRGEPNSQASGVNAGSLHVQVISYDIDDPEVIRHSPIAKAVTLAPEAMEVWRKLDDELGEDLEMTVKGGVIVAETEEQLDYLRRKAAIERSLGIEAEVVGGTELRELLPAVADGMAGGEYCPQEGKLNPLTATIALLRASEKAGTRTFGHTLVTAVAKTKGGYQVVSDRGVIRANRVVNAAGVWTPNIAAMLRVHIPLTVAPIQMVVTEPCPTVTDKLVAHAGRHLTLKQVKAGHFLIGGAWTAHFDEAAQASQNLRPSIEGNLWVAQRLLPALSRLHVIRSWAGLMMTQDGAPLLSEVPGMPGFYCVTSNNGYTLGPLIGQLVAELMTRGKAHRDVSQFSIERFAAQDV